LTAYVILAAGFGSRIGRFGAHLHKALVPLGDRAIISHLIDRAPAGARVIVCVGHRGEQIREYLNLAHPQQQVTYVKVDLTDGEFGVGPGATLLAAREAIGNDDLVVTCCDTLWSPDVTLWCDSVSWLGVSLVPAGTEPTRWCRVNARPDHVVTSVLDKTEGDAHWAWVGLARILRRDLDTFWRGVSTGELRDGERQLSAGFSRLLEDGHHLETRHVDWTDVGDAESYRRAVARVSGYDWSKPDRATYVLPDQGRVVKFSGDEQLTALRGARGLMFGPATPPGQVYGRWMFAYDYVPGINLYDAIERRGFTVLDEFLKWWQRNFTKLTSVRDTDVADVRAFYQRKTIDRVQMLTPGPHAQAAAEIITRVDWEELASGALIGRPHGDLTFANVIMTRRDAFYAIDWREYFDTRWHPDVERSLYGDLRYDLAKLLTSAVIHWANAARGDFTPWELGQRVRLILRHFIMTQDEAEVRDVEIIAALCLLNSAPLHAAPFDEILVARGCAWLEEVL
jgi:choline kinase